AHHPGRAAVRPNAAPFQSAFRSLTMLVVLAALLHRAWQGHLTPPTVCVALLAAALVLLARLVPVAWTRDRPLTLAAPVVFALALWIGPDVAAPGALLACFLHARFAPTLGHTRSYVRFQGAQLALSAYVVGAVQMAAGRWFGLPNAFAKTSLL